MIVELLSPYRGWEAHEVDGETLDDAAYLAIRKTHTFLTDTNHTYTAGERSVNFGGIDRKYMSVLIFRGEGAPEYSGPRWAKTDYWFSVNYRSKAPEKEPTP